MRYGFTTGSCAAAASKAAAFMLLTGKEKKEITIETPKGLVYHAHIRDIKRKEKQVSCAVEKDGGDDPDITTGALVYAEVSFTPIRECQACLPGRALVHIDGGIGVGRVTRPGLDQPVGNAAINHVPREMIEKEVLEVCRLCDFKGELSVVISVPTGEALAEKTFNPRLGIVGGISILGTSGVVEPMSRQALIDTIRVELQQKKAEGMTIAIVSPGNYGLEYMQRTYGYDLDKSVKCSNFIGETIDLACELGYQKLLLVGHIGKLVKLSGGIMNTHSKEGDCRMELIAAAVVRTVTRRKKEGIPLQEADVFACISEILTCCTTEEALGILQPYEALFGAVMDEMMERILFYLNKRAEGKIEIACMMYSNEFGGLAKSPRAEEYLANAQNM